MAPETFPLKGTATEREGGREGGGGRGGGEGKGGGGEAGGGDKGMRISVAAPGVIGKTGAEH